jgi:hypothetical protein
MTIEMIQVPVATWEDLIDAADRADEPLALDDDLRPGMHTFTPYFSYERDSICGHLGCGGGRSSPVHYV